MRYLIVIFWSVLLFSASCSNTHVKSLTTKIDSIDVLLKMADDNLTVHPDLLQTRVDSMKIIKITIDSVFPNLSKRNDEVSAAYNTYSSAIDVFTFYIDQYPLLMMQNKTLASKLVDLKNELSTLDNKDLDDYKTRLAGLKSEAKTHYDATREIARTYIGIMPPYKRKRKVINHMYYRLTGK